MDEDEEKDDGGPGRKKVPPDKPPSEVLSDIADSSPEKEKLVTSAHVPGTETPEKDVSSSIKIGDVVDPAVVASEEGVSASEVAITLGQSHSGARPKLKTGVRVDPGTVASEEEASISEVALASEPFHSEAGSDLDILHALLDSDTASVATEEEAALNPVTMAQIRRKIRRAGRTTPSSIGEGLSSRPLVDSEASSLSSTPHQVRSRMMYLIGPYGGYDNPAKSVAACENELSDILHVAQSSNQHAFI